VYNQTSGAPTKRKLIESNEGPIKKCSKDGKPVNAQLEQSAGSDIEPNRNGLEDPVNRSFSGGDRIFL